MELPQSTPISGSPEVHEIPPTPDDLDLNASSISLNENVEENENLGVQFGMFNFTPDAISPVDQSTMVEEFRDMYPRPALVLPYLQVARSRVPERNGKLKYDIKLEEKLKRLQNTKRTMRGLHLQLISDYYEFCFYKSISEMPGEFIEKLVSGAKVHPDIYRAHLNCFDVEDN